MLSAKSRKKLRHSGGEGSEAGSGDSFLSPISVSERDSAYSSMRSSPEAIPYDTAMYASDHMVESPIEEREEEFLFDDESGNNMLPPTVSTYVHREKFVEPPPGLDDLRRELRESLSEAKKVLDYAETEERASEGTSFENAEAKSTLHPTGMVSDSSEQVLPSESGNDIKARTPQNRSSPSSSPKNQGWYELQGVNILDVTTLAIRAARNYYTAHDQPARLAAIKSERKIREELHGVLDVLKRMAIRRFAGGMKTEERQTIQGWIGEVENMLHQEEERERVEKEEREGWQWTRGDWTGREREREWLFLKSFDPNPECLPEWTEVREDTDLPTPFLKELQNGLRLNLLHNVLVRKSKRPYGFINDYHTDTLKPYRCADNLRYWAKAAELRWEVNLKINVMGIVYGQSREVWRAFDHEILKWCTKVREELTADLNGRKPSKEGPRMLEDTSASLPGQPESGDPLLHA